MMLCTSLSFTSCWVDNGRTATPTSCKQTWLENAPLRVFWRFSRPSSRIFPKYISTISPLCFAEFPNHLGLRSVVFHLTFHLLPKLRIARCSRIQPGITRECVNSIGAERTQSLPYSFNDSICFNNKNTYFFSQNFHMDLNKPLTTGQLWRVYSNGSTVWLSSGQVTLAVNIPQPPLPCCWCKWRCPSLGLECRPWLWKQIFLRRLCNEICPQLSVALVAGGCHHR